ncbi:uncharacterized protein LOC114527767 [Dendronephthya gigantea]|uniref:uncharacterized protein LOC114527767 n=1 Tax=Dendronephthya gigantea TaxID=151771 RepID=UPI00106A247C|nr:uncharacterized protein LOC114527767 [Dendronephthya gigantea]
MRCYFRTKKRQFVTKAKKLDKVVQKTQRLRSRKNTKRLLRERALEESTSINEENKVKYREIITAEYMSSEDTASDDQVNADMDSNESGSENEQPVPRAKKFTIKRLQWRSNELDKLMTILDKKIARKRGSRGNGMVFERVRGSVHSQRTAPLDAPKWALNEHTQ